MPTVAMPAVMRVALEGHMSVGNQSQIVNVFHFSTVDLEFVTEALMTELYDELNDGGTSFVENYLDMMPTTYRLDRMRISQVIGTDLISREYVQGNSGNRVVEGDRAPAFVAALIGWRSSVFGGRRGRGKTYIGGLYEQDINGDNLVGGGSLDTAIGLFLAGTAKYQAGSIITSRRMVIISDPDRVLPSGVGPDPYRPAEAGEISSTYTTAVLAIQKRRKIGRGS